MAAKELFYEDVEVEAEIPAYSKVVTILEMNWFASVNEGDRILIHMDRDYSKSVGLPDIIVMGNLKYAYLANMLTDWIGERGTIRRLTCQYRGMDIPGPALSTEPTMFCKGRVINKYVKDGEHYLECEVWSENQKGERTTPGSALVILPSRG